MLLLKLWNLHLAKVFLKWPLRKRTGGREKEGKGEPGRSETKTSRGKEVGREGREGEGEGQRKRECGGK